MMIHVENRSFVYAMFSLNISQGLSKDSFNMLFFIEPTQTFES